MAVGAAAMSLLFALYTGHVWEDFYITFRSSKNLVAGQGLVFQPGERVHSFTSPLGVLIPAACSWLAGSEGDLAAIWLFRVANAATMAATAALLWKTARQLNLERIGIAALFGLFLLDGKIADFAMNGMETPVLLFFFVWTLWALLVGPGKGWRLGLGFAGLMWSRPDGFIFGGALVAGFALFSWRRNPAFPWRSIGPWLARAGAIGTAIYLPWFLWAWAYYGSPIPNTIAAKGVSFTAGHLFHSLSVYPFWVVMGRAPLLRIFMPSYFFLGGWPEELLAFSIVLSAPVALYFLVPRADGVGRALSLALCLGGAYLQFAPPFPWYYQVWQLTAILAGAVMVSDAARLFRKLQPSPRVAMPYASALRIATVVLIAIQGGLWGCLALEMRVSQRDIEQGVRQSIGLWLRDHARPGERVMLEPLGYVGYFSGLKMLDTMGLSAPEVVDAHRAGARTWPDMIARLKPDWLVLRPDEIREIQQSDPALLGSTFEPIRSFDARDQLALHPFLPGSGYTYHDAVFTIFRRRIPAGAGT